MKNTKNLGLPIYDNPKSDLFKISDVNSAHTIIDETYETMKNAKDHIVEIDKNIPIKNADAEIVDARRGKSTLGEKIREIDSSLENITHNANYEMPYGEFIIPSDMPCELPFKIRKDIDGVVKHNVDFSSFKQEDIIYYVDTESGLDTNDGFSSVESFKTLGKAIETIKNSSFVGNFIIILKGFVEGGDGMKYCTTDSWEIGINKNISIIATEEDGAIISTGYKKERYYDYWQDFEGIKFLNKLDEEFTSVYDTRVLDAYNQIRALKRVETLEECKLNKDTFYSIPVAKGGGLYVNCDSATKINLLNGYSCIVGKYLNDNGELADSSYNPATSQFMEVKGNNSYTLVNAHSPGNNICWYDENKSFISAIKISDSSQNNKPLTVISPSNSKYARVTVYPNNYTNWKNTIKFYDNNSFGIMPISGTVISNTVKKYGTNLAFKLGINSRLYFENITFLSGDICNTDELFNAGSLTVFGTYENNNTNSLWLNNCKIFGGQVGGLDTNGYWNNSCDSVAGLLTREISVYTFNCLCAYNGSDALSYGANPTYNNRIVFEYENIIYNTIGGINGRTANSSTCHNFMNRVSIGVVAYNSTGPIFADATGCYSIFINCHAKNSGYKMSNPIRTMSLFHSDLPKVSADGWGRRGKIILINCSAYGSGYGALNVEGEVDVYVNNFKTNKQLTSDSLIQNYMFD